jgi:hypothetical protein
MEKQMKRYFYSLLFLAALSSHLKSMDRNYWLGGAQEELEAAQEERMDNSLRRFKEIINNPGNWQEAVNEIGIFFQGDPDRIAEIMESDEDSPLRLAVEANNSDVVHYIVEDPNFLDLPDAENYLQTARDLADEFNADTIIIDTLQNALAEFNHTRMQLLAEALEQAREREIQAQAALQEAQQRARVAEDNYRRLMNNLN